QRAGRTNAGIVWARPLNLDRLADGGDLGAGNLQPARDQFRRRKSLPGKAIADDLADKVAQRSADGARGLVHGDANCHPRAMTVAATASRKKASSTGAGKKARKVADAAALLAWYDRHRRTLPWRARN